MPNEFHSNLVGAELHYPLGHSVAGTLTLIDNTASAILWENTGGADYLLISTVNGSERITWGNATENPDYYWLGSGDWSVGGSVGTSGQVLTSNGSGAAPTWTSVSGTLGITGTTSASFTINTDASALSDENASLILIGSDEAANDDLVRYTLTLDSANERLYWTVDRNRDGGGYSRIAPSWGIGTPSSTTSGFDPSISFHSGDGSSSYTGTLTYAIVSSRGYLHSGTTSLTLSSRGSGNAESYGYASVASSNNAQAFGYGAVASGLSSLSVGTSNTASNSSAIVIGCGSNTASGADALVISPGTSSTASHTRAFLIGDSLTSSADNQFMVRCESIIWGLGNTNATPPAVTERVTNASGSNAAAAHWTLQCGIGTGTGAGGDLIVTTAAPGSSGSSLNTAVEAFRVRDTGEVSVGNVGSSASAQFHVAASSSSTAAMVLVAQAGSGDAAIRCAGDENWIFGHDNTDDNFAIANSAALGTSNRFTILPTGGLATISGGIVSLEQTTGTSDTSLRFISANVQTADATDTTLLDVPAHLATGGGIATIQLRACATAALNSLARLYNVHFENNAGTVAVVNSTATYDSTDAALSTVVVSITASGSNLRVRVQGIAATTINWTASAMYGMARGS